MSAPPTQAERVAQQAVVNAFEPLHLVQEPTVMVTRDDLVALQGKIIELNRTVLGHLRQVAVSLENAQINTQLATASRISPKERRVVFVGGPGFSGNVKYAWLDFCQRAKDLDVECWFVPASVEQGELMQILGVPHFPFDWRNWTREHTGAAMRAAVRVVETHFTQIAPSNPYLHALLSGTREVQLWHGISIKEIALQSNVPLTRMTLAHAQNLASSGNSSTFVGASAEAESEWRRWFNFEHYASIGYPRNDVLYREPNQLDLLNVDVDALKAARSVREAGRKVFFYAPTFRDVGAGVWLQPDALNALAAGLASQGHLLLVNLHPAEQGAQAQYQELCPNVGFVAPLTDIYPLLGETDALITDYSSLMFDYLALDRPIIFWRPDHDDYVAKSRKLYDAKLDRPLGPDTVEVADAVRACLTVEVQDRVFAMNRQTILARLFDVHDAGASERTTQLILTELERVFA